MTVDKSMFTHEWISGLLANNPLVVKFTKQNGEDRVMRCTTNSTIIAGYLGQDQLTITEESNSGNKETLRVFDMDKAAWRSFRVDSVYHIEV